MTISVTRVGDTSQAARVDYLTSDSAGLTPCDPQQGGSSGKASERCDYETAAGSLRWAVGESGSRSFTILITDDVHVEGDETFSVTLRNATGGSVSGSSTATVTIVDNDSHQSSINSIDDSDFFIKEQYKDFLGRMPDAGGFQNWHNTLAPCPNNGYGENDNPDCDRVHVALGFFQSLEYLNRAYFAYRFYEVSLGRRPLYREFILDMTKVGGPQSPQQEAQSKQEFTDEWVLRQEFKDRYDGLSNSDYVDKILQTAGLTVSNRDQLVDDLNNNRKTRAQVLREIVESKQSEDKFLIRGLVSAQYFGFLRRDPDTTGFNNWVATLTANPNDIRHMVFGFIYSTEYRGRFGPQ